ncbi:MAG TPA: polysaccharide biosynthesis/export family protein [Steroidobacteraceae bacterium]|nr:polysaccharide biosynthesis/export family protein [Steroidobacteraceae bacterium]
MRAANFLPTFLLVGGVIAAPAIAQTAPQSNTTAVTLADYRLNPGDKIDVSVWKETEMQKSLIIAPDGKIGFPLAGEVVAAGHTIGEVRAELVNRLKKYIPEPVVTVSLTANEGNRVFVIGQVNKPGMFGMNPQLNVLQALSLAGGGTPFAKLDSIIILRQTPSGQRVANFRYSQVSRGEHLEQNVTLESGDVVVVP